LAQIRSAVPEIFHTQTLIRGALEEHLLTYLIN